MAKLKIGIIGCGTIANSAHIPSYMNNKDAEIKYFCDIIPERACCIAKSLLTDEGNHLRRLRASLGANRKCPPRDWRIPGDL